MMLTISNVSHEYKDSGLLLRNVSFTLPKGEAMAIVGPNGCGKTTLLKVALGLIEPHSGTVEYRNIERKILVPSIIEHFLLPWYSIEGNFAYFSKNNRLASDKELEAMFRLLPTLEKGGLHRKTYLLSAGEKATLAYYCAMICRPELVIIDELFANMAKSLAYEVIADIKDRLDTGTIFLFTTHNPDIVEALSTRVYHL